MTCTYPIPSSSSREISRVRIPIVIGLLCFIFIFAHCYEITTYPDFFHNKRAISVSIMLFLSILIVHCCRILTNLLKELCIFASEIWHTIINTLQAVEDALNNEHNKVVQKLKDEIEHLRKQLAWYKTFFDHTSDAVFIVQPDTWSVLDANEQAAMMVGIDHHELVGESLPQFRRVFNALSKSSTPSVLSELTFTAPKGESRMVEVNAGFIEFGGQKVIIASARDVTEQRELSEKMVQADKLALLGKLTAGVAHEIRNPLAAINMNLQVLQRKISAHAPEMFNVQTALQGVERLGNIVEATLNFSRPSIDRKSVV